LTRKRANRKNKLKTTKRSSFVFYENQYLFPQLRTNFGSQTSQHFVFPSNMLEKKNEPNRHLFLYLCAPFLSYLPVCPLRLLLLKIPLLSICLSLSPVKCSFPASIFKYFFTSEEISFLPGLVILFISRLYFLRMATIDPIRFCDNVTVPLFIIELH